MNDDMPRGTEIREDRAVDSISHSRLRQEQVPINFLPKGKFA